MSEMVCDECGGRMVYSFREADDEEDEDFVDTVECTDCGASIDV